MDESLRVNIFNMYQGCELVCEVQAYNEARLVSSWTTDDPRALVDQGIDSTNDGVFEKMHMKKHINKVFELFEPTKIIVEGK